MRLLFLGLAVLTAACTTLPVSTPPPDPSIAWNAHRAAVSAVSRWTVTGRISIQTEKESWNATLRWEQDGAAYRVRLIAPLGQGTVQIAGDPAGVTLRTADDRVYRARDPETLLRDTLGWSVPIRGLRYWMLGRDDPATPAAAPGLDSQGRLERLHQNGWSIRYLRYASEQSLDLPTRLDLSNERLQVRIVVTRWQLARESQGSTTPVEPDGRGS